MSLGCVCFGASSSFFVGGNLAFLGSGRRTQRVRDTHRGVYALVSHRGAYALVSRRAQADNVIPDTCTITGTIRDLDDKVFALIVKRITGVS